MSAHELHIKRVSGRIHPNGVRQLLGKHNDRQRSGEHRVVGHGRSRGLRPLATALLSPNRRISHLFQRRQSVLVRECQDQMVQRDQVLLSRDAHYSRRH